MGSGRSFSTSSLCRNGGWVLADLFRLLLLDPLVGSLEVVRHLGVDGFVHLLLHDGSNDHLSLLICIRLLVRVEAGLHPKDLFHDLFRIHLVHWFVLCLMHLQKLRHKGLKEGSGHRLGADVASDSLNLLLLLSPGHLVPGHGGAVDDGGRCEGELGSGVGALVRLEGVASILVRVPLALELIHSIVPCDLIVVHNVPKGAHPGGVSVSVFLLLLPGLALPMVVNVPEGSSPGVLLLHLLNWAILVGLLQAAGPSTAICILELWKSNMLKTSCLSNLSSAILGLVLASKVDFHWLPVASNNGDLLWWRRSRGVQLLHLGLALSGKSLSHLFLCFGLEPLHPLVLLKLLLGHAQGRGSLCHLVDLLGHLSLLLHLDT